MGNGHRLELRVDADPVWMSSLRALVTDIAIRADFDLDSVADLTLAVDEACAALIDTSDPRDTLVCRLAMEPGAMTVTATMAGGSVAAIDTNSFGWRVIRSLADEAELVDRNGSVGVRLRKRRGTGYAR